MVKLRGLRVYTDPMSLSSRSGPAVFYSRRADGPYYRWLYEPAAGRWCCARVHPREPALGGLAVTTWRQVPAALRALLNEHYLE
ncbi:MAG TPA: hypothetical protein VF546_14295 [Pyrinomonadaceae bacterium]